MKTFLFFFGLSYLIFLSPEGNSQVYYPTITSGKNYSLSFFTSAPPAHVRYEKLGSDTLINSNFYKKVLRTNDSTSFPWNLIGYIRETLDHKVYFSVDPSINEYLYYDFSLGVGDTITLRGLPSFFTVTTVDSLEISNGQIRKRFTLINTECSGTDIWIEGIGSLSGLVYSASNCFVGETTSLICMNEFSDLIYHNPDFATCDFPVGLIRTSDDTKLVEIESISQQAIRIISRVDGIISFYDLSGRLIMRTTIKKGSNWVPNNFRTKTMYIINLQSDHDTYTRKIIL